MFQGHEARRHADPVWEGAPALAALLTASPAAAVVVDRDGSVRAWGPAAERLFGWSAAEVLGRPDPTIPEDRREEAARLVREALSTPSVRVQSVARRTRNGILLELSCRAAAVHRGDGSPIGVALFFTDRGLAVQEEALRRSEARWQSFVESHPDFVVLTDRDSTVRYINRVVVGGRREDVIGRRLTDFALPEYRGQLQQAFEQVWETGCPVDIEMPAQDLAGNVSWFYGRIAVIRDEGETVGMVVARDITQRKRVEQRAQEAEERFRQLAESSDQVFWFTALNPRRVLYVSPAFERIWGVPAQQLYDNARLWVEMIHPEDRAGVEQGLESWRQQGYPGYEMEYRIVRRDGSVRYIQDNGAGICNEQGEVYRLTGVATDVTEKKRAEQELAEREARYRALLAVIPDRIFLIDREGHYFDCHAQGFHQRLAAGEARPGGSIRDFLPADAVAPVEEAIRQTLHTGQLQVMEYGSGRTGDERRHEARLVPWDSTSVIAVVRDVTDRMRAEKEREQFDRKLQEAQKLESLGVLAGGIAHDFNNFLTGILGYANLARMESPAGSPTIPSLQQIEKICLRAAELCRQMLAYAGKGRYVLEWLDLSRLVEDITHLLQISISKKVTLQLALASGLPAVLADATQMRQVVMNLVINASEAIGDRTGSVTITTRVVPVGEDRTFPADTEGELPPGDYVVLEVSDDGPGITEEVRRKIFDPFFTTKFTGRGLGLAAVQGIVRGHKGAIQVTSEEGRGTTFKVLLPCAKGPPQPVPAPAVSALVWKGEGTVLVADDEEAVRSVATQMLEAMGFQVVLATDGREAVERLRDHPGAFRLVLLDLTMPHLNGEEAYREIRRLRPDVPVVLMSGYTEQEVTKRFAGQGLSGFLQKPFLAATLLQMVHNLTTRKDNGALSRTSRTR
jgi:PAS domain S-box-containing protein